MNRKKFRIEFKNRRAKLQINSLNYLHFYRLKLDPTRFKQNLILFTSWTGGYDHIENSDNALGIFLPSF